MITRMGQPEDREPIAPDRVGSTLEQSLLAAASGEQPARDRVFELAADKMARMATLHLDRFPRLRRWSRSDDVMQEGCLRLIRAMEADMPQTPLHFYRLFALQLRRLLIDLHRASFGPEGRHRHHDSPKDEDRRPHEGVHDEDASGGLELEALQAAVDDLPDDLRQVVDLYSYSGLTGEQVAQALGVSLRKVWRDWAAAKARLADALA